MGENSDGRLSIFFNDGAGSFPTERKFAYGGPRSLTAGDFNEDGHLDPACEGWIALGDGDGNFATPARFDYPNSSQGTSTVADFNEDSHLDVAISDFVNDEVVVFLGNGNGGTTRGTTVAVEGNLDAGDLDGDAHVDLVVANLGTLLVFGGDGSGGFSSPTSYATGRAWSVQIAELSGDSLSDLAVGNLDRNNVSVLINQGTALSGPLNFPSGNGYASRIAMADFNRDGRRDLAVANSNSSYVAVLLASTPSGYPRPKGAGPTLVPLVPAYRECASPNRTHGGPLTAGSCAPPMQASSTLTSGTPDANSAASNMIGQLVLKPAIGDPSTPADEADVRATFTLTDVRCDEGGVDPPCVQPNTTAGRDYGGEAQVTFALRLTDRENAPPTGSAGTVTDASFAFTVACTTTSDLEAGSTCSSDTSADAVMPGLVKEAQRAAWGIGNVQVLDGGPDGDVETPSGNTQFAVQGLFVP